MSSLSEALMANIVATATRNPLEEKLIQEHLEDQAQSRLLRKSSAIIEVGDKIADLKSKPNKASYANTIAALEGILKKLEGK